MKANVYMIIEEDGTFEAVSNPWNRDVEMVPEVDAKHLDKPYVCYRKRKDGSSYRERYPAEGKLKYYRDDLDGDIYAAGFWLTSENQSQDVINEIQHQYYADAVSEACRYRDRWIRRIEELNAMWKATVDVHDKR